MRVLATAAIMAAGLLTVFGVGCSEKETPITVAFSNNMNGEIRSCGCGAHDYGGLGRRATWIVQ